MSRIGGVKCGRIIRRMTVAKTHDAYEQGETPSWAWPVYAFVAWLAAMLDYVARFKRIRHTHRFKPDWRDSGTGLRESEWHRDQLIAQGVAAAPQQANPSSSTTRRFSSPRPTTTAARARTHPST